MGCGEGQARHDQRDEIKNEEIELWWAGRRWKGNTTMVA